MTGFLPPNSADQLTRRFYFFLVLFTALFLLAWLLPKTVEAPITNGWERLEKGMSEAEVLSILGEPKAILANNRVLVYDYNCEPCVASFGEDSGHLLYWLGPEKE